MKELITRVVITVVVFFCIVLFLAAFVAIPKL